MPWHPESIELKEAIRKCEQVAIKYELDIAELATLYSLQLAEHVACTTLMGFATQEQLMQAVACLQGAPTKTSALRQEAMSQILAILEPFHNTTW